jgi:hypothetical protein
MKYRGTALGNVHINNVSNSELIAIDETHEVSKRRASTVRAVVGNVPPFRSPLGVEEAWSACHGPV